MVGFVWMLWVGEYFYGGEKEEGSMVVLLGGGSGVGGDSYGGNGREGQTITAAVTTTMPNGGGEGGWWSAVGLAVRATLDNLPRPLRNTAGHTHLVFTTTPDERFLRAVQGGDGGEGVSMWGSDEWWESEVRNSNYRQGSTHVLVGPQHWLLHLLHQVQSLVTNNTVNIRTTVWVLVVTERESDSNTFKQLLEQVTPEQLIFILIYHLRPPPPLPPPLHVSPTHLFLSRTVREATDIHILLKESYSKASLMKSEMNHYKCEREILMDVTEGSAVGVKTSTPVSDPLKCKESAEVVVVVEAAVWGGEGSVKVRPVGRWSWILGLVLASGHLLFLPPRDLAGRPLILTTVHKPGVWEIYNEEGQVRESLEEMGGYVSEVVRMMTTHLNLSTIITTTNSFGVELANGSWSGMIGFLKRRVSPEFFAAEEADLAPLDFSPSSNRGRVIDFSEFFSTDGVIIISQAPQPLQSPFLLLQVFSVWVWLSIMAVGMVTGNVIWLLDHLLLSVDKSHTSYYGTISATLKLFVTQSDNRSQSHSWSSSCLLSCFFLVVITLVAVYQGYIIAFLTVPRRSRPIDSPEDLMQRLDSVAPVVRKNTVYYRFIVNFESYRPIAKKLVFHPGGFLSTWQFFNLIYQGKYVLIDTHSSGVGRAARFESRGSECQFHVSRQVIKNDLDMMVYRRNSVFKDQIDKVLRQLRSFGIIEKIRGDHYATACEREARQHNTLAITLKQMQSAFYLLGSGLIISFFSLIMELLAANASTSVL
ncbi:hypothetical protein Pmani_007985 [Petrolisthes manimaculis]|uniref:Uncharacterized protein n=1 Tax=Petrolisthes manimaculis TaxID=1843537 RepID=A0AAE1Q7A4_9EUCA|nr:hypothetical protein Pmani_007985 [Petrolisthes manimaculis]